MANPTPFTSQNENEPLNASRTRSLKGQLSVASLIAPNSARRRLEGSTLLGSPARKGHSSRMVDIFNRAQRDFAEIADPIKTLTGRVLPIRIRPANDLDLDRGYQAESSPVNEAPVLYPSLETDSNTDKQAEVRERTPPTTPMRYYPSLQPDQTIYSPVSLPAAPSPFFARSDKPASLNQKRASFFDTPPQIASAQIVAMNEISSAKAWQPLSESSASWTDDSKFYRRPVKFPQRTSPRRPLHMEDSVFCASKAYKQREEDIFQSPPRGRERSILPLLSQQRGSSGSIPEWLEGLPMPGEFDPNEAVEEADEVMPLSPLVQIERGSMRYKLRESPRKRCRSLVDCGLSE